MRTRFPGVSPTLLRLRVIFMFIHSCYFIFPFLICQSIIKNVTALSRTDLLHQSWKRRWTLRILRCKDRSGQELKTREDHHLYGENNSGYFRKTSRMNVEETAGPTSWLAAADQQQKLSGRSWQSGGRLLHPSNCVKVITLHSRKMIRQFAERLAGLYRELWNQSLSIIIPFFSWSNLIGIACFEF